MSELLRTSEPVRAALAEGRGVVALETSVLAQGLPHPRNLEAAERMSAAIVSRGAIPAWIGVRRGSVVVGLQDTELETFAGRAAPVKVAPRDLPPVLASGRSGATTVSATVWAAHRAGIPVAATGGIGGVHPGTGDVSADLQELASVPILLVCSGPKSIVDPVATADRLEELGVTAVGYRCERLPFFLAREAPVALEHRVDSAAGAAEVTRIHARLGVRSAILLCNPIPTEQAMDGGEVAAAAGACERRARVEGVRGKNLTPFLLRCLSERTDGRSLEANLALLESNAALAAEVAVALAEERSLT